MWDCTGSKRLVAVSIHRLALHFRLATREDLIAGVLEPQVLEREP
jgi:hypothetical protein